MIADALEREAADIKLALPAIMPGLRVPVGMGRGKDWKNRKDYKIVPICQIDVDKCGKDNIPAVIEVLKARPDVLLLAKSPSENGVKGLLWLGRDAAKDADTYKARAKAKTEAVEELLKPILVSIEEAILEKDPEAEVPKVDKSKLNPNDLMFLTIAGDELYINYNDVMTGEVEDKIENEGEGMDDATTGAQGDYPQRGGIPEGLNTNSLTTTSQAGKNRHGGMTVSLSDVKVVEKYLDHEEAFKRLDAIRNGDNREHRPLDLMNEGGRHTAIVDIIAPVARNKGVSTEDFHDWLTENCSLAEDEAGRKEIDGIIKHYREMEGTPTELVLPPSGIRPQMPATTISYRRRK